MNSWVISSNPETYNAEGAFKESKVVDWVTKNDFKIGDSVYIYEVIPPRGRGGIVYKTEVIETDILLAEKLEDRKFWSGQVYPKSLTETTRFSRLKLVSELSGDGLSLQALKEHGFTAPQGQAHLLDNNPGLLNYVQKSFDT